MGSINVEAGSIYTLIWSSLDRLWSHNVHGMLVYLIIIIFGTQYK